MGDIWVHQVWVVYYFGVYWGIEGRFGALPGGRTRSSLRPRCPPPAPQMLHLSPAGDKACKGFQFRGVFVLKAQLHVEGARYEDDDGLEVSGV